MPDPWQDYREDQARQRRQRERESRASRPGWSHGDDDGPVAGAGAEDPYGP